MTIRKFLIPVLIVFCQIQSFSQEVKTDKNDGMRTLFGGDGKIENGGWGGFTLGYTRVNGKDAFLSGGKGGWLINHRFTLGLAGYGFITNWNQNSITLPTADNYSMAGGYGGLLLEPVFAPFNPIHISVPVIIGGGSAGVVENFDSHMHNHYSTYSGCFVIEPGIDLEINVVRFFRIALNASYRFTSSLYVDYYSNDGIKQFSLPHNAMEGFNAGITFKFGKF
jgi:hypothetical protein